MNFSKKHAVILLGSFVPGVIVIFRHKLLELACGTELGRNC